jgi:hypothetical protein
MSDTSGPTFYAPLGKWDRDSQSWKTSEATSLWALTLSSLTLPTWGGLHGGELCEHPTPALATSGLDFSSLPTPTTDDAGNITRDSGAFQSLTRSVRELPTPTSRDWKGQNQRGDESCLTGALLPTPTSQAAKHGETPDTTAKGFGSNLWDLPHLLPTPAVNMGEGKTLEWWDDWAPRQKSSDGRPAPHGRSLAIEAQRLLPTPRAQEPGATTQGYGKTVLEAVTGRPQIGATTAPPSPDGSTSSDDPHQHQLSLDVQAIPA